jgi:DnaJ-class molecular chaperone
MLPSSADQARDAGPPQPCPHCGGSGILRLGGQRHRTCLPCLGQGQTPALQAAVSTGQLAALRAAALAGATEFSAAVCGAAAR